MSDVELCNDALGYIGKADINNLTDPEPAARQCAKFLPRTLRELQARYDWEHNLNVVDIAAQTAASTFPGFTYKHKLPADFLRFSGLTSTEATTTSMLDATFSPTSDNDTSYEARYLRDLSRKQPVAMRISKGFIHTNFTPIRLVYHQHLSDTTTLPEMFRAAVVAQLAAKLVFPLTRDVNLTADLREMAAQAIGAAQDNEDNDEITEAPIGSTFEDARR
jgi:hypothetical protein